MVSVTGGIRRVPSMRPRGIVPKTTTRESGLRPGTPFGDVVVVRCIGVMEQTRQAWYECLCKCGTLTYFSRQSLGKLRPRKLACEKCYESVAGSEHHHWRGFGEIGAQLWCGMRIRARRRGIKFHLRIEDAWELFLRQNRRCALTGKLLTFQSRSAIRNGTASLDRIESDKDYELGNVQWVHKAINRMKGSLLQQEFVELCAAVKDHCCSAESGMIQCENSR